MVSVTTENGVRLCVASVVSVRYANSGREEFSGGGGGRYSSVTDYVISHLLQGAPFRPSVFQH